MKKFLIGAVLLLASFFVSAATTLNADGVANIVVYPCQKLAVTTAASSTALVERNHGAVLLDVTGIAASTTNNFGEYFVLEQFRITALTGSLAYNISESTDAITSAISGGTGSFSSLTDTGLTAGRVLYAGTGGLLTNASTLTFSSGTLTTTTFSGALSGNATTATSATTAGTVTTAAQSAITSVGTLTGLTVAGHVKATGAPTVGASDYGTTGSVAGSDNGMLVTVGSGGTATSCIATFGATWTTAPVCVAQSDTDILSLSIATTTTTVTVSKTTGFTAASKLHILCLGY